MARYLNTLVFSIIAAIAWLVPAAAKHPAEEFVPLEPNYCTGGHPSNNINDIIFVSRDEKPPLESLEPLEKYMLAGVEDPVTGHLALTAWYEEVIVAVFKFYEEYGYVPAVLDEQTLRSIPGFENAPTEYFDTGRNPLTGNWPMLNATSHSPGDFYIRPLTEDEKQYLANKHFGYHKSWYEGLGFDGDAYDHGTPYDDCWTKPITLIGPVYYVRMYGRNGILLTDLITRFEYN